MAPPDLSKEPIKILDCCKYDELLSVKEVEAKFDPKNTNTHTPESINRMEKVLLFQGFDKALIISTNSDTLNQGHKRTMAAKQAGQKWLPVVYRTFDSEDQEKAASISDNATAQESEVDLALVNQVVLNFDPDTVKDPEILGIKDFTPVPEDKYDLKTPEEDDAVPETKENELGVQYGDLWILGQHRLLCGDATKKEDVDRLMDGQKADMVYTDPPYGVNYSGGIQFTKKGVEKNNREKLKSDHDASIYLDAIPIIAEFVNGPCYTWFADTKALEPYTAISAVGQIHALIIWHKTNATYAAMNAQYKQRHEPCLYWKPKGSNLKWKGPSDERTVWEMKRDPQNNFHPTQKPVELAERAIKNHDVKTVLDAFLGSGSTLIACEKTKRKCFGMEIDPHYCSVILKRWEKYTGKKATKL